MNISPEFSADCCGWTDSLFESLTTDLDILKPSEWAETRRYLPPSVTAQPGFYSFDVTPYWREPLDCLSPQSPVRFVDIMKGVQVGYTVGIIENGLGYLIEHIKNHPTMIMTADAELAQLRLDTYILPMLEHSGISNLIHSAEEGNSRKTGKTKTKLSWIGGGFCVFFGAKNPDKARSTSINDLFLDEWDTFPEYAGKDGRSGSLAEDRTANYEETRKIFRGSTPLITQTSSINQAFLAGDQRYFHVPCRHCGEFQRLRFSGTNAKGMKFGLTWEITKTGQLVEGSVEYVCAYCGATMTNSDKAYFLREGMWIPSATPDRSTHRSYQLSALYSPVGFQSWEEQVQKWLRAWDVSNSRPRDLGLLQQFYNNVLGEPFAMQGESLRMEQVYSHRRTVYHVGEVPNRLAEVEAVGPVQVVTMAADVHKHHIDFQAIGWAPGGRFYSVDYEKIPAEDGENLQDPAWRKLDDLILTKSYQGDDGRIYPIAFSLIDAGWATNVVYEFCGEYDSGVYAVMGRELPPKTASFKEFQEYTSKAGTRCFNVTTGIYKDRLAAALRREWAGHGEQPIGHPNFPQEYPDKFFKELRAESKQEIKDKRTGQTRAFVWTCPPNADNHAWDTLVYNAAAIDMVALDICTRELELDHIDWPLFWAFCEENQLFWHRA